MPPRPILKGLPLSNPPFVSSEAASNPLPFSSCSTVLDSPHVHFPPTPTLTSTEITHSSFIYDRAPIVVAPNTCALPERGGRKFTGSNNNNKGGLGYFHPHAMFQVEHDSSDSTSAPTIFSASVFGNVNECGSLGLFMTKKRSGGPLHEYDYDQPPNHDTQHTQDTSSESSVPSAAAYLSSSLFSPPSSSIPHSSVNLSTWNVYNIPTAPPSPGLTGNCKMDSSFEDNDSYPTNPIISHTVYSSSTSTSKLIPSSLPSSSSNGQPQDNKKDLVDADGKKKRKSKGERSHKGDRTRTGGTQSNASRREFELGGCLGGF